MVMVGLQGGRRSARVGEWEGAGVAQLFWNVALLSMILDSLVLETGGLRKSSGSYGVECTRGFSAA